jgi:hypothetical protein
MRHTFAFAALLPEPSYGYRVVDLIHVNARHDTRRYFGRCLHQ